MFNEMHKWYIVYSKRVFENYAAGELWPTMSP